MQDGSLSVSAAAAAAASWFCVGCGESKMIIYHWICMRSEVVTTDGSFARAQFPPNILSCDRRTLADGQTIR